MLLLRYLSSGCQRRTHNRKMLLMIASQSHCWTCHPRLEGAEPAENLMIVPHAARTQTLSSPLQLNQFVCACCDDRSVPSSINDWRQLSYPWPSALCNRLLLGCRPTLVLVIIDESAHNPTSASLPARPHVNGPAGLAATSTALMPRRCRSLRLLLKVVGSADGSAADGIGGDTSIFSTEAPPPSAMLSTSGIVCASGFKSSGATSAPAAAAAATHVLRSKGKDMCTECNPITCAGRLGAMLCGRVTDGDMRRVLQRTTTKLCRIAHH